MDVLSMILGIAIGGWIFITIIRILDLLSD